MTRIEQEKHFFHIVKHWLQSLSFRTGVIVLLCCIPFFNQKWVREPSPDPNPLIQFEDSGKVWSHRGAELRPLCNGMGFLLMKHRVISGTDSLK